MIATVTVSEIAAAAAASRLPPTPAASAIPPSPNSSTSWITMSMTRARVRLGKRANGTSMTTASPVMTSATVHLPVKELPVKELSVKELSVSRLPRVDVDAFVAAHQADWARLDELVRRRRRLTGDEVDELVGLYQRTTTHLSVLRSAGHDPALAAPLSSRVAHAP